MQLEGIMQQQRSAVDSCRCAACGAGLAADQRYCLECGEWNGSSRVDIAGVTTSPSRPASPMQAPNATQPPYLSNALPTDAHDDQNLIVQLARADLARTERNRERATGALAATAVLVAVIAAGAVGARLSATNEQPAQIIQAAAPAAAPVSAATGIQPFASDWPADQKGWTIVLQELPKSSTQVTQVDQAKQAASAKGLEAGALDSDNFASLTAGNFTIYAGNYASEKEAKKHLKAAVAAGFADASVAEVVPNGVEAGDSSTGAESKGSVDDQKLKDLEKLPPEQQAKERLKLPDETAVPGEPPPKDNKQAGGGSDEVEIK